MASHKAITITAPQRRAVFGFWTADDARQWAEAAAQAAGALANILALAHVYDPGSEG